MTSTSFETGCIICGTELKYSVHTELMECAICTKEFESNAKCIEDHFVCDSCHSNDATEYIEKACLNSGSISPIELSNKLMESPLVKMHGPEHHFLVPAVLLTAYYNKLGQTDLLSRSIKTARSRSKNVLGGYCGFFGACGAGIGTGIFMSIVLNSTPVAIDEWQKSNWLTSESLRNISIAGGPRCCKRDTFIAIETTVKFVRENLNVVIPDEKAACTFSQSNKECKKTDCRYFL